MTQAKLANMLKLVNLASETMVNEETKTGVDIEEWMESLETLRQQIDNYSEENNY